MEIVVALTKKRKSCPFKAGMNRLKLYKSGKLLHWKIILQISSSTAASHFFQLPTYPTTGEISQQLLPTIKFQCSAFVEIEFFSRCKERYTTTINPYSLLMILQSLQFFLFCVQKMILYQIVARISKKLFLWITLCTSLMRRTTWSMKIWIVVLLPTQKLLQKSDRSTENGITLPDPVKNPSAFPATINISVLLMSSIALIFFSTRTIYGTWLQQLLYHFYIIYVQSVPSTNNSSRTI